MGQRRNHNVNKIFWTEANKNTSNVRNAEQQNKPLSPNNNKSKKLLRKKVLKPKVDSLKRVIKLINFKQEWSRKREKIHIINSRNGRVYTTTDPIDTKQDNKRMLWSIICK